MENRTEDRPLSDDNLRGSNELPRENTEPPVLNPLTPLVVPAVFPKGFWASIDYLLHHPEEVIESLRRDMDLWRLARVFFVISLLMSALYGAVMGATNLLQGAEMPMTRKFLMILCTALKVPALYLLTLAIVLPPIYVSNAFVGARLTLRQMIAAVLGAMALTVTILGSMATIAAFFALTSRSYSFIKLLHVVIFAYAGLCGLSYLARCIQTILPTGVGAIPRGLFVLWLLLYMFVGTQMAWVLRPFIGSPGMKFQVFRPRTGNFYESVIESVEDMIRQKQQ